MLRNKETGPERHLTFLDVAKILKVLSLGAGTRGAFGKGLEKGIEVGGWD